MPLDRWPKKIFNWNPAWKCHMGRPNVDWLDIIAEDLNLFDKNINKLMNMVAKARMLWKRLITNICHCDKYVMYAKLLSWHFNKKIT